MTQMDFLIIYQWAKELYVEILKNNLLTLSKSKKVVKINKAQKCATILK